MKKVWNFLRGDPVLCAAWLLAVISAFFVHPSKEYLSYIDFRSLGLLWSLMVIMQVFRQKGLFSVVGEALLSRTRNVRLLSMVLVFLCFFFSMFITNDVSLITFVPFAILMLRRSNHSELIIPVVVLQTVAANLGSMMTPIGNPQNLYLYGISDLSFGQFILLVLPYTAVSFVLLLVCILLLKGGSAPVSTAAAGSEKLRDLPVVITYAVLFLLAFLVVFRVIAWWILALLVLAVSLFLSRESLRRADYSLLLTFVGFFIFTGNMRNIPAVADALSGFVSGRELPAGVLVSQVISNVPAALLLSGFSEDLSGLILGTDIGGLGTMIASMASLISWKLYCAEPDAKKGRYFLVFTGMNLLFLLVLLPAALLLH